MKTLAVAVLVLLNANLFGQVNSFMERQKPFPPGQHTDISTIFGSVEKGISTSALRLFASYLGPQVHLSISGQQDSYFSANQTAAVLQSYFERLKPVTFAFTRLQEKGENPYATGRLTYVSKGNRESVQIYVSLAQHDSKWVISQFNVY